MDEIKNIIDELGIVAVETNLKIAGVTIVFDLGKIIFQTKNWDLTNQSSRDIEPVKNIQEFKRVLKPDGIISFSELLIDPDYPLCRTKKNGQ